MVWGCFSYYNMGPVIKMNMNMSQAVYFYILEDQVFILDLHTSLHDVKVRDTPIFQTDNSRVHNAACIKVTVLMNA